MISRDADAEVRWLATVFGAVEIGNSVIMLFDAKPDCP